MKARRSPQGEYVRSIWIVLLLAGAVALGAAGAVVCIVLWIVERLPHG